MRKQVLGNECVQSNRAVARYSPHDNMKVNLLLLTIVLLLPRIGFSWGAEGHQAIGAAASQMLTKEAASNVQAIMASTDLASIATWMDEARALARHQTTQLSGNDYTEAQAFNAAFKKNALWHFVDLPVGTTQYVSDGPFESQDDVVHAINGAIDVLEGRSSRYSKLQALRVIVHMVGDIHQPLHCASGYFDLTDAQHPMLVSDPSKAAAMPTDRGGNQLFYAKKAELHAMWDDELVQRVAETKDPQKLAAELVASKVEQDKMLTLGDIRDWAARWASDSASFAADAYKPLTFEAATVSDAPGETSISRIEIIIPADYRDTETRVVETQLQKAAVHLAQLLNRIAFQ